jgi:hypothetical protein
MSYYFFFNLSNGQKGFLCGSEICISYRRWCQGITLHNSYNTYFKTCPELVRTFNSDRLCQNASFWKDKGDHDDRCKGNNPGQLYFPERIGGRESRQYYAFNPCYEGNSEINCRDNSELVCEKNSDACASNQTKFCDSNETCIHHTLECDGYIHCPDRSDEEETKCKACPRDFGYPADKLKVGYVRFGKVRLG